jgi:hypothetical protein
MFLVNIINGRNKWFSANLPYYCSVLVVGNLKLGKVLDEKEMLFVMKMVMSF